MRSRTSCIYASYRNVTASRIIASTGCLSSKSRPNGLPRSLTRSCGKMLPQMAPFRSTTAMAFLYGSPSSARRSHTLVPVYTYWYELAILPIRSPAIGAGFASRRIIRHPPSSLRLHKTIFRQRWCCASPRRQHRGSSTRPPRTAHYRRRTCRSSRSARTRSA